MPRLPGPTPTALAFDLDGVLCDTQAVVNDWLRDSGWPPPWTKPPTFKVEGWGIPHNLVEATWKLYDEPSTFDKALPILDAQAATQNLAPNVPVYIITARSPRCRAVTLRWLARNGFSPDGVLFVPHRAKIELAKALNVSHFFEDHPETLEAIHRSGIFAIAPSYPYNQDAKHIYRYSSLSQFLYTKAVV